MTDPVEHAARAAATQLAADFGPALPTQVEAALSARRSTHNPDRYLDPISLGALIVSIATLAWTVYIDLTKKTPTPSTDVMARAVRVRLHDTTDLDPATRDRIIDILVTETARAANPDTHPRQDQEDT
jgi:hypothetical protein